MKYSKKIKKHICESICLEGNSTIKTAEDYAIPLKTLEKWITSYHKNPKCFDDDKNNEIYIKANIKLATPYDDLSDDELRETLMRKDIEIARLKKLMQ